MMRDAQVLDHPQRGRARVARLDEGFGGDDQHALRVALLQNTLEHSGEPGARRAFGRARGHRDAAAQAARPDAARAAYCRASQRATRCTLATAASSKAATSWLSMSICA